MISRTSAAKPSEPSGVDGSCPDHHAQRTCRADHLTAFSAPIIALTIAGSAPRQMKTLVPATSSSIKCECVGEGGLNCSGSRRPSPPLRSRPKPSPPRARLLAPGAAPLYVSGPVAAARPTPPSHDRRPRRPVPRTPRRLAPSHHRTSAPCRRDHLNPAGLRRLRLYLKINSRHKPTPKTRIRVAHHAARKKAAAKHRLRLA